MSNKSKAIASAIVTFIVAMVAALFDIQVPEFAVVALVGVLSWLTGLFMKTPDEKKS